jgi:eukaryotic-like serine/threonine-protein kinase
MDTTVADSLIGTIIDGRYRVLARLARGGMATVYTAMDERLERTVALKIIHPTRAGEPRFLERFTDEAKVIARLTHPNVVAVYDQGTHQGLPYLVLEYVRGRTLREVLAEQRRLSPDEALTILEQMLAAIAAAHRAGLVHRDVKPENVLVAEAPNHSLLDSVVKVADFGLARAVEEASADGAPTGGQLLATVAYVAPELVTDNHADPRTDVYSAGVVLFEMLTGRVPYEAERPVEVAWQHVDRDVPPPSRYVPGLPAALDELVTRATRRDPGGRPTDAGAMLAEVQDARDDIQPPAPTRPRPEAAPTVMVPQVEADTTVQGRRFTIDPVTAGTADTVVQGQRYDVDATVHMARAEDRPQWARLPSARPEPRPRSRRRPAEHHQGAGRLRHLRELVLSHPQGRLAVAAALVVLGLVVAIGGWWFGVGRFTNAPGLVTMQKAGAISLAKQDGFKLKFDAGRYDEKVPKDTVLAQNPAAGARIVSGGTITLTLSKGPERYALPDESGKDADMAQNDLRQLRLTVQVVQVYDDVVPAGVVSGTDPAAQTEVKPGATITLKVSRGRAPVTVPPVVGQQLAQAQAQLAGLGLNVSVKQQDSDKPANTVINQDPADGSGVEKGATVTLTVSKGPPAVQVPDLSNQPADAARQALAQLGLQATVIGGGTVRIQNPGAGTQVPPGTNVVLWCF